MYCIGFYDSPVGCLLLSEDDGALTGLWTEKEQKTILDSMANKAEKAETPVILAAKQWLDRYFAGEKPTPDELPLRPVGTPFQHRVWANLCRIPYGRTTTYKAISDAIASETGRRMAAQAVGQAVGRNPISIVIPCHRVIGTDGSLIGYAGGLDKKVFLLSHEGLRVSEQGIVG